jgi:transposase
VKPTFVYKIGNNYFFLNLIHRSKLTIIKLEVLLPDQPGLVLNQIETSKNKLTIYLSSSQLWASCPLCSHPSSKVQSRYGRTLKDLNWAAFTVQLKLEARRFWCTNGKCSRKIFCERLYQLALAYARRTNRLSDWLQNLALALGGRAGKRLASKSGVAISRHTLLRLVRKIILPVAQTPRVLGVDDWAFRKGHTYGTILVDLEKGRPIELLADRKTQTLADWLKAHSGIEVVSRDRATTYAEAVRQALPQAVQVADRWHLLKNLGDHLHKLLDRKRVWQLSHTKTTKALSVLAGGTTAAITEPTAVAKAKPFRLKLTREELVQQQRRAKRLARYEKVHELSGQGLSQRAIGRALGMSRQTVETYLKAEAFPERSPVLPRPEILDPYKSYIEWRWEKVQPTVPQLYHELKAQGYEGSAGSVRRYLAGKRPYPYYRGGRGQPKPGVAEGAIEDWLAVVYPRRYQKLVGKPASKAKLSARQVGWYFMSQVEQLTETEQQVVRELSEKDEQLATTYRLVQQFIAMVRNKQADQLEGWLALARESKLLELVSFARGLEQDKAAVVAGLSMPYSQGPVEGHVNRLKNIKRSMYGRAGFDLLRMRVLAA